LQHRLSGLLTIGMHKQPYPFFNGQIHVNAERALGIGGGGSLENLLSWEIRFQNLVRPQTTQSRVTHITKDFLFFKWLFRAIPHPPKVGAVPGPSEVDKRTVGCTIGRVDNPPSPREHEKSPAVLKY
jgi:hypothetical protein